MTPTVFTNTEPSCCSIPEFTLLSPFPRAGAVTVVKPDPSTPGCCGAPLSGIGSHSTSPSEGLELSPLCALLSRSQPEAIRGHHQGLAATIVL